MNKTIGFFFIVLLFVSPLLAQEQLPKGTNPPAIAFEHFPNRIFALVWRNWNLVEPERIAKTIRCEVKDVHAVAASMGLPAARPVPPAFQKQIYITVLRRNWHLLPYDQLLTMADMSADQLEFALKEDDFLFHKFGNLKPACEPLIYHEPDRKAWERAKEIKEVVKRNFGQASTQPAEPLFSFIDDLSSLEEQSREPQRTIASAERGLRFIYSYFGVFGDPLIDAESNPYPDGLLSKLAASGVNGIWMHVVLNQLAPGDINFPEFGEGHAERLRNLQRIAQRASKYGIKVYLYMNEPRAMPISFFEERQDMAGVRAGDFITMCTSNEKVLGWVRNSLEHVFEMVPELGGVFTITASENLTNCASHGGQKNCPRCSKRDYADIIAGINAAIEEGVHRGNPDAKVLVWDWGWHNHGDAPDVIAKLPKNVWLMSVSEWAKPIERGGVASKVGEYSISAVGPGPRAKGHWSLAKSAGLKTVAKVQFNNTWELSAIPWIPALDLVTQHAANLAKADTDGFMLSWTLGGYPSPNLEIAKQFSDNPNAEPDAVLQAVATARYGTNAAAFARKAWTSFSNAFQEFPYNIQVVYHGPQQYGPANLLYAKPTGYRASMVGFPYDDIDGWRGPYSAEILVRQFERVADGWKEGLEQFEKVLEACASEKKDIAYADWRLAKAAYLHFASSANQGRFILERNALLKNDSQSEKRQSLRRIDALLDEEVKLATELFAISRQDSRIGFEASNQYYYVPQDLMEKVINCEYLQDRFYRKE